MKCAICNSVVTMEEDGDLVCHKCQFEHWIDVFGDDCNDTAPIKHVSPNGVERWTVNSFLHRLDGPAEIGLGGKDKRWWERGLPHRLNGPCLSIDPSIIWLYYEGCIIEEWCIRGKRHRLDGPAVTLSGGAVQYWIDGERYSYRKWKKKVKEIKKGEEPKAKRWELGKNSIKNFLKKMMPRQEG